MPNQATLAASKALCIIVNQTQRMDCLLTVNYCLRATMCNNLFGLGRGPYNIKLQSKRWARVCNMAAKPTHLSFFRRPYPIAA